MDSRLGESPSPKRDGLLPKTNSSRLSELLEQREIYEFLHVSSRRA